MSRGVCRVCLREVEEDGDKLCERCVADYADAEAHVAECPCGPCCVYAAVVASVRFPATLPEVRRWRDFRQAEPLAVYLARRDAPPPARVVLDVPREEAHLLLHAVTTIGARLVVEPGRHERERAAAVRLASARLEGV